MTKGRKPSTKMTREQAETFSKLLSTKEGQTLLREFTKLAKEVEQEQ